MTEKTRCPECGNEFKNGRALHAHKFHCKKAANPPDCDGEDAVGGQHDWKLLKLNHPSLGEQMRVAKANGYKEFCDNCGEMR